MPSPGPVVPRTGRQRKNMSAKHAIYTENRAFHMHKLWARLRLLRRPMRMSHIVQAIQGEAPNAVMRDQCIAARVKRGIREAAVMPPAVR